MHLANDENLDTPAVGRRKSVSMMIKLMSALALMPKQAKAAERTKSRRDAAENLLDSYRAARVAEFPSDYPKPAWIPSGYKFSYSSRKVQGGFHSVDEVLLLYANSEAKNSFSLPLHVTMAKNPQNQYGAVQFATPTEIPLTVQGNRILGEYYDGMWAAAASGPIRTSAGEWLAWDRSNCHVLVFDTGDVTVAVRGFRLAGVSKSDLTRIAESII